MGSSDKSRGRADTGRAVSAVTVDGAALGRDAAMSPESAGTTMLAASAAVRVGILHSLTGVTAISESPLVQAAVMAIDEINQAGGVLGRRLEPIVKDGCSDPLTFRTRAEELLDEGVAVVFGCWSSASRKAVKPVIEGRGSLLFYPMQYEGLEQSANIIYTGSCPNQQFEPAVKWALSTGKRSCFLIGSDYVYPRTANALVRALMEEGGAEVLGERYVPLTSTDFESVADEIERTRPDIVFNAVAGCGNLSLFTELSRAGLSAEDVPVMSFSFSEVELQAVMAEAAGHYACWGYFQSSALRQNRSFLRRLQRACGQGQVASDPVVTSYSQVHLWSRIVGLCGSLDPGVVAEHAVGQTFDGPAGRLEVMGNNHVTRRALIGRATTAGEFEVVWRSPRSIDPKPWLGAESSIGNGGKLIPRVLSQYSDAVHLNWGLAEEIKRRQEAEEALRSAVEETERANREIQRREEVAEDLGDILTALNSDRPLAELLGFIIVQAQRLLGGDTGGVYRADHPVARLRLQASTFLGTRRLVDPGASSVARVLSKAAGSGQSVAASGAEMGQRAAAPEGPWYTVDAVPTQSFSAMLAVPILVKQEVWGVLALFNDAGVTFSAEDVALAETIGDHAALAIENARLREQVSASATAAERSRLGRELHDSVTQSLFAAALISEAITRTRPDLDGEISEQLLDVQRLTTGALAEMRSLLLEMRPGGLQHAWLGDLLVQLVQAAQSRCLATIDCTVGGRCAIPVEAGIAMYRIAQEALGNVTRHSMASHVEVSLACGDSIVVLEVVDDGVGFDAARPRHGHFGLQIMRERAQAIGARLEVRASPGDGTRVRLEWRMPEVAQDG